jgi:hypothetical protein
MAAELSADLVEQMRRFVRNEVRGGFTSVADIPTGAVEYLLDDAEAEVLRPHAEQYTAEALVALSEEEKGWPQVTDCDRLDSAFARLEAAGVVARQNFSCCQNCGHAEMWDEVQAAAEEGRSPHGYTFYHGQDTEAAVEGHGLCLAYGAVEPGEEALAQVGHEVVAALRGHGLQVRWDGSTDKRISVSLDWKRRRA